MADLLCFHGRFLSIELELLVAVQLLSSKSRPLLLREKLGLRDFKFHDLRKTFGSSHFIAVFKAQNGIKR